MRLKLLGGILYFFISSYAYSALLVAGNYTSDKENPQALILTKTKTQDWQQVWPFLHENNITASGILSVHCLNAHCGLTSWYEQREIAEQQAALFVKDPIGLTWEKYIPNIENGIGLYTYLPAVHCGPQSCIAVGEQTLHTPLNKKGLIVTIDEHKRLHTFYPLSGKAALIALDCTDSLCMAVGEQNNHAAIVRSLNHGLSWEANFSLAGGGASQLYAVSCQQNACIAIGNVTVHDHNEALILTTHARGDSWEVATLPIIKNAQLQASQLDTLYCSSYVCITAGYYQIENIKKYIILLSYDAGKHWVEAKFPFNYLSSAAFSQIDCAKNFCVIASSVHINDRALGALLISNEHGENWRVVWPYSGWEQGKPSYLSAVSCSEKKCSVLGDFIDKDNHNHLAVFTSKDGLNWDGSLSMGEKITGKNITGAGIAAFKN